MFSDWKREWLIYAENLCWCDVVFLVFLLAAGFFCVGVAVLVLLLLVSPNEFNRYNFFRCLRFEYKS